jgi:hypothetical protein
LSAQKDERPVPDFADVDEDAPTNLVVPDLADDSGDATMLAMEHPTAGQDAATVVSVDPAGARAGREADEVQDDAAVAEPSDASPPDDQVASEPSNESPREPPMEDREGAKHVVLPEAMKSSGAARAVAAKKSKRRQLAPRLVILGALVVGAAVVGITLVLVEPDGQEPRESPEPMPPVTVPVATGEPAGTVHATTGESATDLEQRAADLVAAGRFSEAVGLYEAMLEEEPSRRELEIALGVLRQRAEEGQ